MFTGGGSHGAVQAGMLLALEEAGVKPDLLIGTSAGAMNAAFIAGRPYPGAAQELVDVWLSMKRSEIFPANPFRGLAGLLGRRNHTISPGGLRSLLARHINFSRLEEAPVELRCILTELESGRAVEFRSGDTIDVVTASCALPGLYPPVDINGRLYIDGGVSNNAPIKNAIDAGAETIYLLATGHSDPTLHRMSGALHVLLHSMSVMIHERLSGQIEQHDSDVTLCALPVPPAIPTSIMDFSRSADLIERSHLLSRQWLTEHVARN